MSSAATPYNTLSGRAAWDTHRVYGRTKLEGGTANYRLGLQVCYFAYGLALLRVRAEFRQDDAQPDSDQTTTEGRIRSGRYATYAYDLAQAIRTILADYAACDTTQGYAKGGSITIRTKGFAHGSTYEDDCRLCRKYIVRHPALP